MERSAVLFAGAALKGVSSSFGLSGGQFDGIAAKLLMGSGVPAIEAGDEGEGFNDPELVSVGDDVEAEQEEGAERLVIRVVEVEDKYDEFGKFFNVFLVRCRYGEVVWSLKKRFSQFHRWDLDLRANVATHLGVAFPTFPRKTLFNSGQNPAQIDQRRCQLDDYVTALTRLVAKGPSTLPIVDAKEEARNIALMHLTQVKPLPAFPRTCAVDACRHNVCNAFFPPHIMLSQCPAPQRFQIPTEIFGWAPPPPPPLPTSMHAQWVLPPAYQSLHLLVETPSQIHTSQCFQEK